MKDKTIYYAKIKFRGLETGLEKFGCQLIMVGLLCQIFLTQEQKQVLQESVNSCVFKIK